jgi:hypothetical protein
MSRWTSIGAVLCTVVISCAPAWAVGDWTSGKCRDGDLECQRYVPACMECHPTGSGGGLICEQVHDGETGYDNCRTVFYGTFPSSCTAWGSFCTQITVVP